MQPAPAGPEPSEQFGSLPEPGPGPGPGLVGGSERAFIAPLPLPEPALQRYVLYESELMFYMVAFVPATDKYRMLRISRSVPSRLSLIVDDVVYDRAQIHSVLHMLQGVNAHSGGLRKRITAYGLIGFIRFVQGYYIMLITQRSSVGKIGPHEIFTIDDTAFIPITSPSALPKEYLSQNKQTAEARYKSLIANLDLTKNFYFSYTYDLTRSLQSFMLSGSGRRPQPEAMFVWNEFLLREFRSCISSCDSSSWRSPWILPLIHGYFEQKRCSVFSKIVTLYLVSRRSSRFAGTRYLKRGCNSEGFSANEVEIEQIVHDRDAGSVLYGQFSSFVQLRASIPLAWVQEPNAMVARPPILLQRVDPGGGAPLRRHAEDLMRRYGSPLLFLSLIRQRERVIRESKLGDTFTNAVKFLNSFIENDDEKLDYFAWDFKKVSKDKSSNVVDELAVIAQWALQRTGLFHSAPTARAHPAFREPLTPDRDSINARLSREDSSDIAYIQRGVCRCNCIDSLDRTNVAQFCIGKCAMGYQLYAMRLISGASLDADSPLIVVLVEMYERMGDCVALQYGGSNMHRQMRKPPHRARTRTQTRMLSIAPVLYRMQPPSRPKEMFVSLVRHYQNSFQDRDKQDAINLLLGQFVPSSGTGASAAPIWEMSSDFYLHNRSVLMRLEAASGPDIVRRQWLRERVRRFDRALEDAIRRLLSQAPEARTAQQQELFFESCHESLSLTDLASLSSSQRSRSVRLHGLLSRDLGRGSGVEHRGVAHRVIKIWHNFYPTRQSQDWASPQHTRTDSADLQHSPLSAADTASESLYQQAPFSCRLLKKYSEMASYSYEEVKKATAPDAPISAYLARASDVLTDGASCRPHDQYEKLITSFKLEPSDIHLYTEFQNTKRTDA